MLNNTDFNNFNNALKELYRCTNLADLRSAILAGLDRLVPYDSAACFEVDPQTYQFVMPYHKDIENDMFDRYQAYYEKKDIYKKTVFSASSIPVVDRSTDYMDYGAWEHNEHRVDFLLARKIYYISCLQIINDNQLVGEVSLHRSKTAPNFSDREMLILRLLHDHINNAFSTASLLSTTGGLDPANEETQQNTTGVFLLNREYKLVSANKTALAILSQKLLSGQNVFQHLVGLCRNIAQTGSAGYPASTYSYADVLRTKSGAVPYRIVYIRDTLSPGSYTFMTLLAPDNLERDLPEQPAENIKFTPREQEIISLLSVGNTNQEIAEKLYLSLNTVKTHLKNIYAKAGVSSRTELTYKLWELTSTHPGLFSFEKLHKKK